MDKPTVSISFTTSEIDDLLLALRSRINYLSRCADDGDHTFVRLSKLRHRLSHVLASRRRLDEMLRQQCDEADRFFRWEDEHGADE